MDGISRREALLGMGAFFLPRRKVTVLEDLTLRLGREPSTEYFERMGLLVSELELNGETFQDLTFELIDRWNPRRRWFSQGRGVSVQTVKFRSYRHYVQWWSGRTRVPL